MGDKVNGEFFHQRCSLATHHFPVRHIADLTVNTVQVDRPVVGQIVKSQLLGNYFNSRPLGLISLRLPYKNCEGQKGYKMPLSYKVLVNSELDHFKFIGESTIRLNAAITCIMSKIFCDHFPLCSGCQFIGTEYGDQKTKKITDFTDLLQSFYTGPIGWLSAGEAELRDRLDFVWEQGVLGLYSHSAAQTIDIKFCQQLSPELNLWYQDFRKIQWPIKKGSMRLRVGPQGQRGVWLDFSNLDIKNLLEEKTLLSSLLDQAVVEVGQKRKILEWHGSQLKLQDPKPHVWFQSLFAEKEIGLFSHIASFTQPSMKANRLILLQITSWAQQSGLQRASEFGAGIGNLSIPLLALVETLRVFENDALSSQCFEKTIDTYPELSAKKKNIHFFIGDHLRPQEMVFFEDELLLVNPPRSGLKGFIETLRSSPTKPREIIYLACAPGTFAEDGQHLSLMGYEMKEIFIVDQFPQSQHYEVLGRWLFQGKKL
jgi:23S rRNA (uracil1939-C5)-methyltransferase